MSTITSIVIAEDVADTMCIAHLGPRWGRAYEAAAERYNDAETDSPAEAAALAEMESIEAAQESGEADYAHRWAENCESIADARGVDARVLLTQETWRATQTRLSEDDTDTVEREIWQAAHDATALPEGW